MLILSQRSLICVIIFQMLITFSVITVLLSSSCHIFYDTLNTLFNPLHLEIHAHILHKCSLYISYGAGKGICFAVRSYISWYIISSFILVTLMCD